MTSKLTALILIVLFSFHSVDAAPIFRVKTENHKTCCGRPVCLCTHAKGAMCTFKKLQPEIQKHSGKKMRQLDHAQSGKQVETDPIGLLIFKTAPCHSEHQKQISVNCSKEFEIQLHSSFLAPAEFASSLLSSSYAFESLFDKSIEKPPQNHTLLI